jgi:bifunctional non-homologous end joining protein LigD
VLPDGARLPVTNLDRRVWPGGVTRGELMRYYIRVAPWLLPVLADRPVVMQRYPSGVSGPPHYQQRAPARVPDGVRVERVPSDRVPRRLVGGALQTLLYTTQLAAISQDAWLSRVVSPDYADHVVFDLDPMPGVSFAQVLDVARFLRDELETLGTPSVPKTSGAEGLHIYVPLPAGTRYDAGRLFCQIVATIVAHGHPRIATVARARRARGRAVYIECLQNIRGKTVATAYSARATPVASVSTPLTWREVDAGVDPREFTIRTVLARIASVGDLWASLRESAGADLRAALRYGRAAGAARRAGASATTPCSTRTSGSAICSSGSNRFSRTCATACARSSSSRSSR